MTALHHTLMHFITVFKHIIAVNPL